jgi:hypothetical protein
VIRPLFYSVQGQATVVSELRLWNIVFKSNSRETKHNNVLSFFIKTHFRQPQFSFWNQLLAPLFHHSQQEQSRLAK